MTKQEREAERKRRIEAGESIDDLPSDEDLDEDPDDEEDPEDEDLDEDPDDEEDPEDEDLDEDPDDEEDPEDKKPESPHKRKYWRDKAKELEKELEALKKGKLPETKKKTTNQSTESETRLSQKRSDFRFDHPELKTSVVDQIEAYARSRGISLRKAAHEPLVKILIRKALKKSELAKSSIDPGRRSQPTRPKKDWNMSDDLESEARRRSEAAQETRK